MIKGQYPNAHGPRVYMTPTGRWTSAALVDIIPFVSVLLDSKMATVRAAVCHAGITWHTAGSVLYSDPDLRGKLFDIIDRALRDTKKP